MHIHGVTTVIVESGLDDPSLNPRQDCLHFTKNTNSLGQS